MAELAPLQVMRLMIFGGVRRTNYVHTGGLRRTLQLIAYVIAAIFSKLGTSLVFTLSTSDIVEAFNGIQWCPYHRI